VKKVKNGGFLRFWLKKAKNGQKRGFLGVSREVQKGLKRGLFRGV